MSSKIAKRLGLVLAATLGTLVAGELVARAAFPAPTGFHVYPPGMRRVFSPAPGVMKGVEGDARFEVNSIGLRGDEQPAGEAYRVLVLGGSTAECAYIDQPKTWPELLEGHLARARGAEVWVGNGGRSGFTSRRHVVQLRHLLEAGPDWDAVVVMMGVNDLALRLEYGDDEPAPSTYASETVELRHAFSEAPLDADRTTPWHKRLGLWRAARQLSGRASDPDREQDSVGLKYGRWRKLRHEARAYLDELPDLEESLAAYERNTLELIDLAREHDVRLVLVNQPSMWHADMPHDLEWLLWLGGVGDYQTTPGCDYYSVDALREGMTRYNELLRRVATEHDIEFVDAAAALPKSTESFYDDVHFNDGGSRRVAEVIAEVMAPRTPGG